MLLAAIHRMFRQRTPRRSRRQPRATRLSRPRPRYRPRSPRACPRAPEIPAAAPGLPCARDAFPSDGVWRTRSCGPLRAGIGVEIEAVNRFCNEPGADGEVAEALAFVALRGVSREDRIERCDNSFVVEVLGIKLV